MRTLTRARAEAGARTSRRPRGATMIEFVLILPVLLFVTLFTIDMGNVILTNGAMQDAAYSAARSGAQVGGGALVPSTGTFQCTLKTSCRTGVSYDSFRESVAGVPGYSSKVFTDAKMQLLSGARCTSRAGASVPNNHVTVKVTYTQRMLTPGLTWLMQWTGSDIDDGKWQMSVTAVSRCEVVR